MELAKPNLILFDWDNTLVDTLPVIAMAMKETLGKMGMPPFSAEEQKTAMNMSLRDRFPILFGDKWEEAREIYYGAYDTASANNLRELDGAGEVLAAWQSKVDMGLVSNKRGDMLRKEVQSLGWGDYFVGSTGAGDADEDKPSQMIYLQFLRDSGLDVPQSFWMVGDSLVDMQFAKNIGATGVFIGDLAGLPAEFQGFASFDSVKSLQLKCESSKIL